MTDTRKLEESKKLWGKHLEEYATIAKKRVSQEALTWKLWPDINADLMARACRGGVIARAAGQELDITAFAAMLYRERRTVHRMLKDWESKGYVVLERRGRRTLIYGTKKLFPLALEYMEYLRKTQ